MIRGRGVKIPHDWPLTHGNAGAPGSRSKDSMMERWKAARVRLRLPVQMAGGNIVRTADAGELSASCIDGTACGDVTARAALLQARPGGADG